MKGLQFVFFTRRAQIPYQKPHQKNLKLYEAKNLNILGLRFPTYIIQARKFIKTLEKTSKQEQIIIHGAIPIMIIGLNSSLPSVVTAHHLHGSYVTEKTVKGKGLSRFLPWKESFLLPIGPLLEKKALKKAEIIATVSNGTATKLTKDFQIPKEKIRVIHNGIPDRVNVQNSTREEVFKFLNFKDSRQYFLFVGALIPRKGIEILIKSIAKLRNKDYYFILAGSGNKNRYQTLSKKLGVFDRIIFTGFISDELLMGLYMFSSGIILSSYMEGFPTVLIEAMNFGVPVITSNTDGGSRNCKRWKKWFSFPDW